MITDTKTNMPFDEKDDYVKSLLEKATDNALKHKSQPKKAKQRPTLFFKIAAAACVAIAVAMAGMHFLNSKNENVVTTSQSPLDNYLSKISDQEASDLFCYEVEGVAEYE
ncbi:MAG: hypothetical protein Q4E41_09795 [Bacteroidales bacterium]|nr:hypothetical protein [Bacteroidales bacterium]